MDGAAVENSVPGAPTQSKDDPRPPARSALVEEAARVAVTLNEKLPPVSGESPAHGSHKAAPEPERESQAREETVAGAPQVASQRSGREEIVAETATEPAEAGMPGEAVPRGRVARRAATVGANVGENLRPRVEKLREASTVVFDEAADDPGLRFVIIAAVLFILFLFIFLFSYILG